MTQPTQAAAGLDPYNDTADYGPWRFLHRLNPLSKAAALLPVMVLVIFTRDIYTPLLILLLTVALILVGAHLSRRALVTLLVGLPVFVVVIATSFGLWTAPGDVDHSVILFQIGEYRFYLGAFLIGLATSLRLSSLLVMALLGGLTTTGPDMVRSMVQQLKVPYRIGYTALAAYRFVPRFGFELETIRQAHRVRGVAGGRGPIAAFKRYYGYVIPLLAGAIRHAERVALAMDSRAFGAHPTRTERFLVPFRVRDWVFVLAFWAAVAVIVVTSPPG
ncbi:energy-coupling factor transporter transmembrane protein EcfT [Homoserinimonas sp. OAct 916]|uniref:energy-coupling factor transporter transmembrane component T family protein n=1 Tax=Homoserinimonas sp. OAct 916 TaxID=2211450 RepID=UPI000DBE1EF3|nr:energy-coupling factor transporter transmembrane component T [Homoserinimonas sp. OAct 916]